VHLVEEVRQTLDLVDDDNPVLGVNSCAIRPGFWLKAR